MTSAFFLFHFLEGVHHICCSFLEKQQHVALVHYLSKIVIERCIFVWFVVPSIAFALLRFASESTALMLVGTRRPVACSGVVPLIRFDLQ